jgi:hypothetical protein
MTDLNPVPRFQASLETRMLTEMLLSAQVGETVTFTDMSTRVGYNGGGGDPHLQSAKNRAFNEKGAVFDSVRGVGYKRLNDKEIVSDATRDRERVGKSAKRAIKKLATVKYSDLPESERLTHNVEMTILNAQAALAKRKTVGLIEARVNQSSEALTLAKTIEALR